MGINKRNCFFPMPYVLTLSSGMPSLTSDVYFDPPHLLKIKNTMSKPVILCVDDEIVVLNSLKIQLKNELGDAYLYEVAESAEEALELIEELEEDETNIIVIVSDWLMPGMKGDDFLIQVHQKYPNIIKVMLTGQADQSAIERVKMQANLHNCLYKPWDKQQLIETIKSGL